MTPICTFLPDPFTSTFPSTCLSFSLFGFLPCLCWLCQYCLWTPLLAQWVALSVRVWNPSQTHSLPSSSPVKSSGAIWIGVPTMLPDIMASGLQNPKSVILARFCLSSCQQSRVRVTPCRVLHTALNSVAAPSSPVGVYLTAVPNQSCLQSPVSSFIPVSNPMA